MQSWQLQEAKAHLSEVIRACTLNGPQFVSVRGKEEAVIISKQDYEKLTGAKLSFIDFMAQSPLRGLDLDLARDKSGSRDDIDLEDAE
jgi:prevent-host-death family protein